MNRLDQKQLNAIVRLQNEDDFKIFMEWVYTSYITEALMAVSIGKEPERSWMQGRVQQLGFLRDAVDQARNNLAAIAGNKGE